MTSNENKMEIAYRGGVYNSVDEVVEAVSEDVKRTLKSVDDDIEWYRGVLLNPGKVLLEGKAKADYNAYRAFLWGFQSNLRKAFEGLNTTIELGFMEGNFAPKNSCSSNKQLLEKMRCETLFPITVSVYNCVGLTHSIYTLQKRLIRLNSK